MGEGKGNRRAGETVIGEEKRGPWAKDLKGLWQNGKGGGRDQGRRVLTRGGLWGPGAGGWGG